MITKLDHVAIAVTSLDASLVPFQALGLTCERIEEVAEQHVRVALLRIGDVHLELLEPTSGESPIAQFLTKRGPGLHHVALESDDVAADLVALRAKGLQLIDEVPRRGAGNKLIAFLHPRSLAGVLTELCGRGPAR